MSRPGIRTEGVAHDHAYDVAISGLLPNFGAVSVCGPLVPGFFSRSMIWSSSALLPLSRSQPPTSPPNRPPSSPILTHAHRRRLQRRPRQFQDGRRDAASRWTPDPPVFVKPSTVEPPRLLPLNSSSPLPPTSATLRYLKRAPEACATFPLRHIFTQSAPSPALRLTRSQSFDWDRHFHIARFPQHTVLFVSPVNTLTCRNGSQEVEQRRLPSRSSVPDRPAQPDCPPFKDSAHRRLQSRLLSVQSAPVKTEAMGG